MASSPALGKGEVDSSILSGSTSFGRHHRASDVSPDRDALLEVSDLGVDAALERERRVGRAPSSASKIQRRQR